MEDPSFYIALVVEVKPPGSTDRKAGFCQEIVDAREIPEIISTALKDGDSVEFFFSTYMVKPAGGTMCVEDYRTLAEAQAEWPTAQVRDLTPIVR